MDIALFSTSTLFADDDDFSSEETKETEQSNVERRHSFPGMHTPLILTPRLLLASCVVPHPNFFPSFFSMPNQKSQLKIHAHFILCQAQLLRKIPEEEFLVLFAYPRELLIREFSFHQLNANLLWPGTFAFAEWLVQNRSLVEGRHCIELGSGTGALAIFLHKSFHLNITTSDFNDQEIEENIAHNCRVNGVTPVLPHIRHSWGDTFPAADPDWDLVIASDILLYVKQYPNLIKTLSVLLKSYKPKNDRAGSIIENEHNGGKHNIGLPRPAFLMSWRRRIGKKDESLFFDGCESAGFQVKHLGSRVYCITPKDQVSGD